MAETNALLLLACLALIALATGPLRMMPFLALMLSGAIYGLVLGSSFPWVAKEFNTGFGLSLAMAGMSILAGFMLSRLIEEQGGFAWVHRHLTNRRSTWSGLLAGALAGMGGTAIGGLAILTPLGRMAGIARARTALAAAHGASAVHGVLVPSPLPVAALAILGADLKTGLLLGLPVALAQLMAGFMLSSRVPLATAETKDHTPPSARAALGGWIGFLVLAALLLGQSLGQIPSEPLGGGNIREDILGLGRPMVLVLGGLGLTLLVMGRLPTSCFAADGTLARGAQDGFCVMLAVGAAAGFQTTLYNTGMAPLLAERLLTLPPALGIAIPFLLALVNRALQGSALTAVITAAGMAQPLLVSLGLDSGTGKALAALAVGAGAMAAPHLNDGWFWLAAHQAGFETGQALRRITLGMFTQALAGLAVLATLCLMLA